MTISNTKVFLKCLLKLNILFALFSECLCPCHLISTKYQWIFNMNLTKNELVGIIVNDFEETIKPKIMVNPKHLSKMIMRRNSAMNRTMTAIVIGWGFTWIVLVPFVLAVILDFLKFLKFPFGWRKPAIEH